MEVPRDDMCWETKQLVTFLDVFCMAAVNRGGRAFGFIAHICHNQGQLTKKPWTLHPANQYS